jgi:hypothetical protein
MTTTTSSPTPTLQEILSSAQDMGVLYKCIIVICIIIVMTSLKFKRLMKGYRSECFAPNEDNTYIFLLKTVQNGK